MRESTIVKHVKDYLNSLPGCRVCKNHGGMYTVAGRPDLEGVINGRHIVIEVKRPGEKPTKLQQKTLDEYRACGSIAGVATSVNDVVSILSEEKS